MERRNGKACGLFKKKMREERERDWDWRWLSKGLLGFEFLLGFAITEEKEKDTGLVCWVLFVYEPLFETKNDEKNSFLLSSIKVEGFFLFFFLDFVI